MSTQKSPKNQENANIFTFLIECDKIKEKGVITMKKIISVVLMLVCSFALISCTGAKIKYSDDYNTLYFNDNEYLLFDEWNSSYCDVTDGNWVEVASHPYLFLGRTVYYGN